MISVDNVYKTFQYKTFQSLINSDVRGNIKPDELRLLVNDVVGEIVEGYFADLNRMITRKNKGLVGGGLENLPNRIGEQLRYFLKSEKLLFDGYYFLLPKDYRYIDSVIYDQKTEVAPSDNARNFHQLVQSDFA